MWKAVYSTGKKEQEQGIEESVEALKILENELQDKKFFGGESLGFVDIAAVYVAFWVPLLQDVGGLNIFTSEKFPKLYKWSQELLNHSFVKENLPPRDPLFAYFRTRHDSVFASK